MASGYFTEEVDHVVDGVEIQNEFHEGSTCSRLYEEMTELEKKLCEKLRVDEQCDLERIIDCMDAITKEIANSGKAHCCSGLEKTQCGKLCVWDSESVCSVQV